MFGSDPACSSVITSLLTCASLELDADFVVSHPDDREASNVGLSFGGVVLLGLARLRCGSVAGTGSSLTFHTIQGTGPPSLQCRAVLPGDVLLLEQPVETCG